MVQIQSQDVGTGLLIEKHAPWLPTAWCQREYLVDRYYDRYHLIKNKQNVNDRTKDDHRTDAAEGE